MTTTTTVTSFPVREVTRFTFNFCFPWFSSTFISFFVVVVVATWFYNVVRHYRAIIRERRGEVVVIIGGGGSEGVANEERGREELTMTNLMTKTKRTTRRSCGFCFFFF